MDLKSVLCLKKINHLLGSLRAFDGHDSQIVDMSCLDYIPYAVCMPYDMLPHYTCTVFILYDDRFIHVIFTSSYLHAPSMASFSHLRVAPPLCCTARRTVLRSPRNISVANCSASPQTATAEATTAPGREWKKSRILKLKPKKRWKSETK